jgi:uncharacterized protein (DUF2236 family)
MRSSDALIKPDVHRGTAVYDQPTMVVQRINSERLVVLGWSRAILLQVAHPLLAAAVTEHSSFRGGALQAAVRLHHTVSAMLSLMFGRPEEREDAVNHIRAIHRTVHGTLKTAVGPFPAGTSYSAQDPALLLWVHATLLDSTADIYRRVVEPLTADDLDAVCRESAPLLHELGGDPAATPLTWSALQQYLAGVYRSGVLAVGQAGSTLGHAVLSPRAAGMVIPFTSTQRLLTIGLLPSDIRDAYGLEWSPKHQRRFERALRVLRHIRRATPPVFAHWRPARVASRPKSITAAQR